MENKILLILQRTLGDCILINTLTKGIKVKYPDSEITVTIWPEYKDVIETNPDITNLFIEKDWDRVLKEAVSNGYDKVMIPYQLSHTCTCWHNNNKFKNGHLLDFYAKRCGITIPERKCYMYPTEGDIGTIDNLIKDLKIDNSRIVAMHTTSLVTAKDWPIEKFNNLAAMLKDKGYVVCQIGTEKDKKIDATLSIDLTGRITLRQIAAFLIRCKCFIGIDSGISYIAASQDIPVICIMGMSSPITSGPIGNNVTFIEPQRPPECSWPCHTNCRLGQDRECIKNINTEQVFQKFMEIIDKK